MPEPKFIVDFMLGRLCRWLRFLGYDTVFFKPSGNQIQPKNIGYESLRQRRIVLTRNKKISSRKVYQLIVIESDNFVDQIRQVFTALHLVLEQGKFFTRCLECNFLIEPLDKEKVKDQVPLYVYQTQKQFSYCSHCQKFFWKGSHWDLALSKISEIL